MEVEGLGAGKDFKLYPGGRPGLGRNRDRAFAWHPARGGEELAAELAGHGP